MSKKLSSKRAKARAAAAKWRSDKREWRRNLLDLVVSGYAYDAVAARAGVSVSTIKREVQRALDQRPPEPAETFVAIQRQRVSKAMQYADIAMERGDVRAIAVAASLLLHFDRYWRLESALDLARKSAGEAQMLAPTALKSLSVETEFPPPAVAPAPASSSG